MAFVINFLLGVVVGAVVTRCWQRFHGKPSDVFTISGDKHVLQISDNGDGSFHVSVLEKSILNEKSILDMNVTKNALYDVIDTARNKGYIDSDAEALILAKYEG
ncbi:MAG: hypothetical protein MJZ61_00815 [Bacteroidales bacterium]|nr:hypothetical protein [Bacteroidales bacterium]